MFATYAGVSKPALFATLVGSSESPKEYDFIIAGGGTAGCVLASRLSEDPNISVLLVEAGESDQKQLMSRIPAGWANLFNTPAEWQFHTVEQEALDGRSLYQPRGKMLGGCSSINAMIYQHCAPSDYDHWEELGATGWNWSALKGAFRKAECFTPSPDHKIDPQWRGTEGSLKTSYPNTSGLTSAWVAAGAAAGIPANGDLNVETNSTGITRFQTIIDAHGQRSSTSAAYLPKDIFTRRSNLKILTGTTVSWLIFNHSTGSPRCTGIEVGQSSDGPRWTASAKREVIVCQGAFGSPQLLLASGIGPAADLDALGVPLVKDLPGVGKNLLDHILTTMSWKAKKGSSLQFLANPVATLPSLARWLWSGKGALMTNLAEGGAFLRSDDVPGQQSSIAKGTTRASNSSAPDLELVTAPLYYQHHGLEAPKSSWGSDYLTIASVVLRPFSVGQVTLRSANMFEAPLIDPKYLTDKRDVQVLLEGMKLARRIARVEPLAELLSESVSPFDLDTATDEQLIAHMKTTAETIYHPTSTCKIGSEKNGGVVDPSLKVHGIAGLRVCDASVFPDIVSGHPVAAVIAVAERFADMLKAERA